MPTINRQTPPSLQSKSTGNHNSSRSSIGSRKDSDLPGTVSNIAKDLTSNKFEARSWLPFNLWSVPSEDSQSNCDEENPPLSEEQSTASVKNQKECPAKAMAKQITKKTPTATEDGKVEYPKNDPKWQRFTAINGTAALAIRNIKGPMSFCIVMSLFLLSGNRNTSTKEKIGNLVGQQQKNINREILNNKAIEQFPAYMQGIRDEGNELFKKITTEELKREKCQAELAMALHDELEGWEEKYGALKNQTLTTLTEQDTILKEMTNNVNGTLTETIVDLEEMKSEVKEGRAAIEDAKAALLAQYTIEYEKAQYNIDVAEDTLADVQDKVESAKNRMEKTRNNINKHKNRGPVRKKILGKASDALNYAHEQFTKIGETKYDFQTLGTPEEYAKKLDEQFQPTEDLLEGLEDTADLIIANNENGLVTHNTLAEAHNQSSQELRDFIDQQDVRYNLLKQTESIYQVYETKVNATQAYINGTESNKLDQNATLLALDEIKEKAADEVANTFNKTILSKENEERFDKFDNFKDWMFWILNGSAALGGLYALSATARRTADELNDRPNSSLGKFGKKVLNERFDYHDDVGVQAGRSRAGKLTETRVRGLNCQSKCEVAGEVLFGKKNRFFNVMALVWLGTLAKEKYLDPAFKELDKNTQNRVDDLNKTLSDAKKSYHNQTKAACVESHQSKLSVSGLNGVVSDEIQRAYDRDPDVKQAVDFLRTHQQDPECQDPTLNQGLKFQDMSAEEILENCDDLATNYVNNYFQENFNIEEYNAEFNELMKVVKEGDSDYNAKRKFDHWAMGVLFAAVIYSEVVIKSHKYKDPDEVERHDMGAKNRGFFKNRDKKPVPEALARMNHLFNYLDVQLNGRPLLPEVEGFNHMDGYDPKNDPDFEGERVHYDSTKKKRSWLPCKKGLSRDDKAKIDQIKSQVANALIDSKSIPKEDLEFILESEIIIVHDVGHFREATSKKGWLESLTNDFKERLSLVSSKRDSIEREPEDDDPDEIESVATRHGDIELALFKNRYNRNGSVAN